MQQLQKTTLTSLLAHYEPLVIAGLVFVAHLVLRAADRILVGAFNDDGAYVALGQALAGGVGYRLIYLVGDPGMNTLLRFRDQRRFKAESGGAGGGQQRHGRAGQDLTIPTGRAEPDAGPRSAKDIR